MNTQKTIMITIELYGESAQRFLERAHLNETTLKQSIDFTQEINEMREVLNRSNFN